MAARAASLGPHPSRRPARTGLLRTRCQNEYVDAQPVKITEYDNAKMLVVASAATNADQSTINIYRLRAVCSSDLTPDPRYRLGT